MQNAEAVLGILRERGKRGLPCNELYRQLFNPQFYLLAYGRIYSNKGAMTPGVTAETVDGMSMGKIGAIIEAMRHERYRFKPSRRILIPKKNGKTRPLGLPTWSDKLVGEVVRLLLEAYYEPTFSGRSHGFRPHRGCHTALREVANVWKGTTWFIEGDIADCFGSLDHEVLIGILSEKIHDGRFLALISGMLTAGYLEDWKWGATVSGAPQGGIASPVLSNIYLHKLDEFVEDTLIPDYTRGRLRKRNPAYRSVEAQILRARRRGETSAVRELRRRQYALPSQDPQDPGYRRLRYIRYADDHLLGFAGPKAEAEAIKERLGVFLREELRLELSPEKTLVTHARTGAARFLGYDIRVGHNQRYHRKGRRAVNGEIQLGVPDEVIKSAAAPYMAKGKPGRRAAWIGHDDYSIVANYGAKYRGIAQYYMLAGDIRKMHRLRWVMETSMLKTLAGKHGSSVSKMAARYKAKISTPQGLRTCFEATLERKGMKPLVARFGGFPLARQKTAVINDRLITGPAYPHKELIDRLRNGVCEICGSRDGVRVHHVKALADLGRSDTAPQWAQIMAARRRKTIIVCGSCYELAHR
ncbi:reverse transcriptase domain-containing protein [Pseudarthrobacter sp. H2]|uniref:reverse transcriptase/maturase family protein n=1 Tax=Pseudarthrobacter sp. H2 TaxID=3418415 RepID=UPI003CED129E